MEQQIIKFTAPDRKTAELIAEGVFIMLSFGTENLLEYTLDTIDNAFYLYIREKVVL